jgi:hypothetical protein
MPRILVACLAVLLMGAVGCAEAARYNSVKMDQFAAERSSAGSPAAAPAPTKADASAPAATAVDATAADLMATVQSRKIIYTATFSVQVKRVDEALDATRRMAERAGGYVQSLKGAEIMVRVPSGRFNEAVGTLSEIGQVVSREVAAQDVNESYADLEIRIKASKAMLGEYTALLEKSANVEEALRVEHEIGRLRAEIEQLEGVLARLANEVTYATLTVRFSVPPPSPVMPELKVSLPVPWLKRLGLESLMNIAGR